MGATVGRGGGGQSTRQAAGGGGVGEIDIIEGVEAQALSVRQTSAVRVDRRGILYLPYTRLYTYGRCCDGSGAASLSLSCETCRLSSGDCALLLELEPISALDFTASAVAAPAHQCSHQSGGQNERSTSALISSSM